MKPVLLWATSLLLVHTIKGQNDWYNPDGQVGPCIPSDSCNCQFTGRWELLDNYFDLKDIAEELEAVEKLVDHWDEVMTQTQGIMGELDEFESRIQNMSVEDSVQEYRDFERKVSELNANVEELLQKGISYEEILEYEMRIMNVTLAMDSMWQANPYALNEQLSEQVKELTGKVSSCQHITNGSYFRGDSLPLDLKEDWCDSYEPVAIGDSLTHGTSTPPSYHWGNWFKDPYPVDNENIKKIWQRVYPDSYTLSTFIYGQNYSDFVDILAKNSSSPSVNNVITWGLGYIMYNGSLYYHYEDELLKFTLSNEALHKVKFIAYHIGYHRGNTRTYVDMKVDEYGFYAIYADASNEENLTIRKMNPHTLETIKEWNTNRRKQSELCATFMVCGKMYTLDNCWSRLDTDSQHNQYTYDTLTEKESYENWHLTAKFGHVYMVGYNPRERLLFAWDNGHLVTYPLVWKKKTHK